MSYVIIILILTICLMIALRFDGNHYVDKYINLFINFTAGILIAKLFDDISIMIFGEGTALYYTSWLTLLTFLLIYPKIAKAEK